jgi:hypothetical protein
MPENLIAYGNERQKLPDLSRKYSGSKRHVIGLAPEEILFL